MTSNINVRTIAMPHRIYNDTKLLCTMSILPLNIWYNSRTRPALPQPSLWSANHNIRKLGYVTWFVQFREFTTNGYRTTSQWSFWSASSGRHNKRTPSCYVTMVILVRKYGTLQQADTELRHNGHSCPGIRNKVTSSYIITVIHVCESGTSQHAGTGLRYNGHSVTWRHI